ncbi:MAG TPA: ATP-binding cassette domain-containing protein [Vicinamibacterales bacterium]|jgi:ABC-type transporter Mla maintaining outer membrane lipid asymmetry ATPase subunit MlaF
MPASALELNALRKSYGGLRPLRVNELRVPADRAVALLDLEAAAVEVLVNLVTGASLPDEGDVRIFERSTASIESGDAWLALLDRFGIVSERVVLLEEMPIAQNLALPYTLELDAIPPDVQARIDRIAAEVALPPDALAVVAAQAPPEWRARLRLARALALNPELLLLEHPSVGLSPASSTALAATVRAVVEARGIAALIITADRAFADAAAHDVYSVQPASGTVARTGGWRRWFGR